jgi:uncharacterized YigZ family protein
MKTSYKTLAFQSEYLYKEKGSKFIGYADCCKSESDIKSFLGKLKELHPQATHICYAYKIGVNKIQFRANDDGEPNNSAGAPILGQINSFELSNVIIAVVRYYGGTKLGVGGLITAYKAAAKSAIEENKIIEEELSSSIEVKIYYEFYPLLMRLVKQKTLTILNQIQGNEVFVTLEIENIRFEEIKMLLSNIRGIAFVAFRSVITQSFLTVFFIFRI